QARRRCAPLGHWVLAAHPRGRETMMAAWRSRDGDVEEVGRMRDPYAEKMRRLIEAVLHGPGKLDPRTRQAAAAGDTLPEALSGYVEKVARSAYRVTDADIEALKAAGYSEDQVFELTVSA